MADHLGDRARRIPRGAAGWRIRRPPHVTANPAARRRLGCRPVPPTRRRVASTRRVLLVDRSRHKGTRHMARPGARQGVQALCAARRRPTLRGVEMIPCRIGGHGMAGSSRRSGASHPGTPAGAGTRNPHRAAQPATGVVRHYTPPRLWVLTELDALLEVLGPAQANYGGSGLP